MSDQAGSGDSTEWQAVGSQWGIVELLGHRVVAGQVSKSEMLGTPMLRVDVPEVEGYPAFTQFYGNTAIYAVTFVSEEVARRTANACRVNPVSVYVPDIITREKFDETVARYEKAVEQLQQRLAQRKALPDGLPTKYGPVGDVPPQEEDFASDEEYEQALERYEETHAP